MRIIHVTPGYAPAWAYGGPARVVYELAHAQRRRGHRVKVFTTDTFLGTSMGARVEYYDDTGVEVVRVRNLNRLLAERLRLFLPLGLTGLIERELPAADLVHIHELRTFYNLAVCHEARRARVPYVICPHGTATHNGQRELAKQAFDRIGGARAVRGAAALLALTPHEATDLTAMASGQRVIIIPNGVGLPQPASPEAIRRRRAAWGVDPGEPCLLYFGRIAQAKGIDLLVRALAEAPLAATTARLVVCGPDDGALAELRALGAQLGLAKRISFVEPLFDDEKYVGLQAADLVVVPRFTGQPLVLLEAAACGRPALIATTAAGLPWLAGSGGVATSPEPRTMAQAIADLLRSGRLASMGAAARAAVAGQYSWDSIAALYDEAYHAVAEERDWR